MAPANQRTENQSAPADRPTTMKEPNPSAPKEEPPRAAGAVAVAAPSGGALAVAPVFEEDAGKGMEGATQEAFAIPFLKIIQKTSPQVDETNASTFMPEARPGQFYENVSKRLIDGKGAGFYFIQCAFRRVFLKWGPRASGGGFKGEMMPEEVSELRAAGKIVEMDGGLYFPGQGGEVHPEKCDRVADHRNHYGLLVEEATGAYKQVLISFTSTQIKKSKNIMSNLDGVKLPRTAGGVYTPATWANRIRFSSVPEKNAKGNWMGWNLVLDGQISSAEIYQAGRAFHNAVRAGAVEVKYEEPDDPTTVDADRPVHTPGKGGEAF